MGYRDGRGVEEVVMQGLRIIFRFDELNSSQHCMLPVFFIFTFGRKCYGSDAAAVRLRNGMEVSVLKMIV